LAKIDGNLAISMVGLDELDQRVLRVAVGLLSDDGVNYQLLAKNNAASQLVVIDVDTEKGKKHLFQENENQLTLLLGSSTCLAKNHVAMAKPIRVSSLKELLEKVHQRLRSTPAPPIVVPREEEQVVPLPVMEDTLFEVLYRAKQQKQIVKLNCDRDAEIFINGVNGTVAANEKSHRALDKLLKLTSCTLVVSDLSATEFESVIDHCVVSALDACLWKAGVSCPKGIILSGHSMDAAVKLKAWPGFTRHDFKPEYFKIAAILARHAISLNRLVEALKVPKVEIINFYNAAYAVGLIDVVGEAKNAPLSTAASEAKPVSKPSAVSSSIFGKLARRLGFNV